MSTVLLLVTSIGLATGGQLLLKAGMTEVGDFSEVLAAAGVTGLLSRMLTTWQVVGGLGVFGLSAVFWLLTLSRVPLSTAYPAVSLSYVLIIAFSYFVLNERPSPAVWAGVLFIMLGISLVGIGQR